MRTRTLRLMLCFLLTLGGAGSSFAQPTPRPLPAFAEVEAAWTGFWTAIAEGNLEGARRYVHSSRWGLFPGKRSLAELQEIARQMAACRLDRIPYGLSEEEIARSLPPGMLDELFYRVHCQHGGETAETLVGLRRDWDGVWRFTTL